jgi:DNA-binding NarL/FixJ family response regulator
MHRLQELVRLHRMGLPARQIATELGMGPNTERRYRQILAALGCSAASLARCRSSTCFAPP